MFPYRLKFFYWKRYKFLFYYSNVFISLVSVTCLHSSSRYLYNIPSKTRVTCDIDEFLTFIEIVWVAKQYKPQHSLQNINVLDNDDPQSHN